MKKGTNIVLILGIVSFLSLILSFMAEHDIAQDYLSLEALKENNIVNNAETLPEWTNCKGEWSVIRIDYLLRLLFIISVFIYCTKERRKDA